jgi:RNase P subunit RPR2
MKNKDRKKLQLNYAQKNIDFFFSLLEKQFNPNFDKFYIREIKKLSQSFNIRLKREEKLKFCKTCEIFWNAKTREIRLNDKTKCKEYICKNCSYVRKFKYK